MAFTLKLASCCLCYFIVACLAGYEAWASFEIERGKYDTFRNLLCNQTSKSCTTDQCQSYRAECVDQCVRCQCSKDGRNTFLMSSLNTGNCTSDEDIIPESVPERSFHLEKRGTDGTNTNQCLTVAERGNDKLFGKSCASSFNMRWITTMRGGNKFQLMNVMTLQCIEFLQEKSCESKEHVQIGKVAMKQCNKSDGQYIIGQHLTIYTRLCGSYIFYLRLKTEHSSSGEYPAFSQRHILDSWKGLHLENVTYRGCYRFNKNERFMLYLDNETKCRRNSCAYEFSAPIFSGNKDCRIQWSDSKILYSRSATWQNVSGNTEKFFSIQEKSNDTKMLMVNQRALQEFHGSLLRLAISCGRNTGKNEIENQCLLLKFKYLGGNTGTESPAIETTRNLPQDETTTMNLPEDETTTTESSPTTVKLKHEDTEESSIHPIAIAVPVAVLAIILVVVLLYFACYRKQKREKRASNSSLMKEKRSNDQGNMNNPNYSQPSYADPNTMYDTPAAPGGQEATARYEYIDNENIAKKKQPQPEQKYDYATNTEIPRINLNPQPNSNSGQPELNYDYAANTDIPRINLDTMPGAKGPSDQPELKYDYAINTEIPRINLNTPPKSSPASDPTYNTLEEENPPAPYYSTLEDPAADETKSLVTYDTPHSGDPVYNVLEESG